MHIFTLFLRVKKSLREIYFSPKMNFGLFNIFYFKSFYLSFINIQLKNVIKTPGVLTNINYICEAYLVKYSYVS